MKRYYDSVDIYILYKFFNVKPKNLSEYGEIINISTIGKLNSIFNI